MRPTPWTYLLGALVLLALGVMYVRSFVIGAAPVPMVLVLLVGVPFAIGAVHALRTSLPLPRLRAVEVVAATAATVASLAMSREMGIPPLVAVAMVAIVAGVAALGDGPLDDVAAGAAYSGAFVGLLAPTVTVGWYWVVLAGAVAGVLWSLIGPAVFQGVGGRMGVVAFMAAGAVYWLADLLGADHQYVLLPEGGLAHWSVVVIGATGAIVTWMLMTRLGWAFNLASGLPALAVCGVLAMAGPEGLEVVLATAFFGGTFVGGSSVKRMPTALWLGASGLLYGALMLHFEGPLSGHVGVIGATGTTAVLAVLGVRVWWAAAR
jgi:hypothetical protein